MKDAILMLQALVSTGCVRQAIPVTTANVSDKNIKTNLFINS